MGCRKGLAFQFKEEADTWIAKANAKKGGPVFTDSYFCTQHHCFHVTTKKPNGNKPKRNRKKRCKKQPKNLVYAG